MFVLIIITNDTYNVTMITNDTNNVTMTLLMPNQDILMTKGERDTQGDKVM